MSNFKIGDDIIDSNDLINHLEELKESFVDDFNEWLEENPQEDIEEVCDYEEFLEIYDSVFNVREFQILQNNKEEIDDLQNFHDELEGYGDFEHGTSLINEDYFEEYCKELLKDCGELPADLPSYIENNIDWDGVAHDLRADYTESTIDNQTYLMRC